MFGDFVAQRRRKKKTVNHLYSAVDEIADCAHPAAQVEIARRAMAHPGTTLLNQRDLLLF
jgi:hypothetical protein